MPMVCDPRSRAGERASDLSLLARAGSLNPRLNVLLLRTLASRSKRSEPSLHSLTNGCTLYTRSSLPATRVSWKHFTSLKTSHCYCGRKHSRCLTQQRLRQRAHTMRQRLVALVGSHGQQGNTHPTHTSCWRQRHQQRLPVRIVHQQRQGGGMAS